MDATTEVTFAYGFFFFLEDFRPTVLGPALIFAVSANAGAAAA